VETLKTREKWRNQLSQMTRRYWKLEAHMCQEWIYRIPLQTVL
jgi:hypothetical protein